VYVKEKLGRKKKEENVRERSVFPPSMIFYVSLLLLLFVFIFILINLVDAFVRWGRLQILKSEKNKMYTPALLKPICWVSGWCCTIVGKSKG